ncbi:hypothetical protein LJB99_01635 [Deltaproteobacteria bacterium OttesenSCG-928-K17]|nr:hypothetical protein [Deltaproteobacteria bacterium OttesenSCG-928-K17]
MSKKTAQKQDGLEKLLRYMLGLRPDEFGLKPDKAGYVPLKALLAALHDEDGCRGVREGQLAMLCNQPGGAADFEIENGAIRLKPALSSLPPEAPGEGELPKLLYLPLKPQVWPVFHEKGVFPKPRRGQASPPTLDGADDAAAMDENEVNLWADEELAKKIGRRLSPTPVLVTVRAVAARQAGAVFKPYSELLWTTAEVPARFLNGPPVPPKEEAPPSRKPAAKPEPEPAGSFFLGEPEIHRGKKKGKHEDSPDWKNQTRRDRRRG